MANHLLDRTQKISKSTLNYEKSFENQAKQIEELKNQLKNKKNYLEIPDSLEEIENQIADLHSQVEINGWHIGQRLIAVKNNYIDNTEYKNIYDYAFEKFKMGQTSTKYLMFVASAFTECHVRDYGSKLRLLQPLDENKRKKYLEWIEKDHPTFHDIEEKIKAEKMVKIGRPTQEISLQKTQLVVNFKKLGISIDKNKKAEFLEEIKKVIKKYSS